MTLIPAYGRDYRSAASVIEDWAGNKDFINSESGKYINKPDFERYLDNQVVCIRYNKLKSKVIIGD